MSKYLENILIIPSFLVKDLYEDDQNINDIIVKYLKESLIDLRNSIKTLLITL